MYNEMYDESNSKIRKLYSSVNSWLKKMPPEAIANKNYAVESHFKNIGITFSLDSKKKKERIIPFDLIPRIFTNKEWLKLEKGAIQRTKALNAFLYDIYNSGEIFKAGIIPKEVVYKKETFLPSMMGFTPPRKVYSPIIGIDLIRTSKDEFYVLEDNCRTPSGVSYMLENRELMMRMFPDLFINERILPIDDYPTRLPKTPMSLAPRKCENSEPIVVLLTPGPLNSAYYEHSFLSDQMGIEMVQAEDLYVDGEFLFMKTVNDPMRVDVVYRRIDDNFLEKLLN